MLPVACAPFDSGTYSVVNSVRLWVAGQSLKTSSRGKECRGFNSWDICTMSREINCLRVMVVAEVGSWNLGGGFFPTAGKFDRIVSLSTDHDQRDRNTPTSADLSAI